METQLSGYCEYVSRPDVLELHKVYHDTEYGFPKRFESDLFERLILEINQAGLSWEIILKKRSGFRKAYAEFEVDRVAMFTDSEIDALLTDPGIIRNRLKVRAAIYNAQVIVGFRESHGGFAEWLDAHHPLPKADWIKLFKRTFRFTGGEITNEFLMSLGYLPGAHEEGCPIYEKMKEAMPPFLRS